MLRRLCCGGVAGFFDRDYFETVNHVESSKTFTQKNKQKFIENLFMLIYWNLRELMNKTPLHQECGCEEKHFIKAEINS